eukprot:TRINITY_DN8872_c0_g1_i1.p1 TRINITY_DN8872_c0_g1~~TRINITY_DN8872_c0_g1_i1.p1  ORF type:complete len:791 (-),score=127.67 TRINITY_DN8872_c0_g1_i1:54-2426(-)
MMSEGKENPTNNISKHIQFYNANNIVLRSPSFTPVKSQGKDKLPLNVKNLNLNGILENEANVKSTNDTEELGQQRLNILKEIINTERTYVKSVNTIVKVFLLPLRESAKHSNPIVSIETLNSLFGPIESLAAVNTAFLNNLESLNVNDCKSSTFKLSTNFLQLVPQLDVYTSYVNNYEISMKTLSEARKSKSFREYEALAMNTPTVELAEICDYLITPIQRIPRYILLLKEYRKAMSESHSDYVQIGEAIDQLSQVTKNLNDSKREAENLTRLVALESMVFFNTDVKKSIVTPDRIVVCEDVLPVRVSGEKATNCHIIVFSDKIFFTKPKKLAFKSKESTLQYLFSMGYRRVSFIPSVDYEKKQPSIMISRPTGAVEIIFESEVIRDNWIEMLKTQQANRVESDSPEGSSDEYAKRGGRMTYVEKFVKKRKNSLPCKQKNSTTPVGRGILPSLPLGDLATLDIQPPTQEESSSSTAPSSPRVPFSKTLKRLSSPRNINHSKIVSPSHSPIASPRDSMVQPSTPNSWMKSASAPPTARDYRDDEFDEIKQECIYRYVSMSQNVPASPGIVPPLNIPSQLPPLPVPPPLPPRGNFSQEHLEALKSAIMKSPRVMKGANNAIPPPVSSIPQTPSLTNPQILQPAPPAPPAPPASLAPLTKSSSNNSGPSYRLQSEVSSPSSSPLPRRRRALSEPHIVSINKISSKPKLSPTEEASSFPEQNPEQEEKLALKRSSKKMSGDEKSVTILSPDGELLVPNEIPPSTTASSHVKSRSIDFITSNPFKFKRRENNDNQ